MHRLRSRGRQVREAFCLIRHGFYSRPSRFRVRYAFCPESPISQRVPLNRPGWAGILFAPFAPDFSRFSRAEERISPIRAKPPLVSSRTRTAVQRTSRYGAGWLPVVNENGE